MATITTRAGKGSPLTNTEVDDNFSNLNTDKAENGANSDITSMSGITGSISEVDSIQFDADATNPSHSEGQIFYDQANGALAVHNGESDITLQVGQEEYVRVYNDTASTITNGSPVYITGEENDFPTIALASATSEAAAEAIGLATHSIEASSFGFVTVRGLVGDLDTSSFTAGNRVHVSTTAGALQEAAPTHPNFAVDMGIVLISSASSGCLYVDPKAHHAETFRTTGDLRVDADLTVGGNFTVLGTQTIASTENVAIGGAFNYLNSGDAIGDANTTFTGTGLDDGTLKGYYEGTASNRGFYVEIDGVGTGTGGVDTFKWSHNSDLTSPEATTVDITGSEQALAEGISILFLATTGHTSGDKWGGTASPTHVDTGIFTNRNTGSSGVGYTHMGFFWDASGNNWALCGEYDPEPSGVIDTAHASFNYGDITINDMTANDISAAEITVSSDIQMGSNDIDFTTNTITDAKVGQWDSAYTLTNAITATATEINVLDGIPATLTATELGYVDGVTSSIQTQIDNIDTDLVNDTTPQLGGTLDANGNSIDMGTNTITDTKVGQWDSAYTLTNAITATATEINKLDGVTATTADINKLATLTSTTAELNTLDGFTGAVADLNYAKDLRATGVTSTEFDYLDGVTSNIQTQLDGKLANTNDMTLTLTGDATGSATFTDMGNASLTVAVANNSHDHTFSNISDGTESVQDVVGAMVSGNSEGGIAVTYDDTNGKLDFNVEDPTITLSGAVTGSATMTNLGDITIATTATSDPTITLAGDLTGSVTLTNLASGTLTATVTNDSHNHTVSTITDFTEQVEDTVDAMFSGGTHSGISVTYDDTDGTLDLALTADPTVSLTGDVTGTGTMTNLGDLSLTTSIASNSVGVTELNVSDGTSGQFLQTDGAGTLSFATVTTPTLSSLSLDNHDGITVDSSTNVSGIANLYASGNIGLDSTDYISFTGNTRMDVTINGSNEFRFESDGDFHADGDIIAYSTTTASDERLKDNIQVVEDAVAKVEALRGVTFDWKRDGASSAGVIAQEVQEVLPQAVKNVTGMNGEDHLTVNYGALTSILIEAVKELSARVKELEGK